MWVVQLGGGCCCGERGKEENEDFVFEQFIDDFVMKKTLKYHLMNYVLAKETRRRRRR